MRRYISFCLSLILLMVYVCFPVASAAEVVSSKQALARLHADEFIEGYDDTKEGKERNAEIVSLIARMESNEIDRSDALASLASMGIYAVDQVVVSDTSSVRSSASHIVLNTPTVLYDSYNNRWVVSCGGYWTNDTAWQVDGGVFASIGGKDAIAIGIYDTSGTYNSSIVHSYAYYSDGETEQYVYSPRLSSGTQGTFFEYTDSIHTVDSTKMYYGKHFAVVVTYDSNFENFHGVLRGTYVHTWGGTSISSVSFGSGGGYNVSMSNSSYYFICQSSSEKRF